MRREAKLNRLASETVEVCVRVLVRKDKADEMTAKLEAVIAESEGCVANMGGYTDSPEWDDLEDLVDEVENTKVP
jgi:hypothetical protein